MLLLKITLSGLSQSSEVWKITENSNKDTIIVFSMTKSEIMNLRMYVTELETYKDLNILNESLNKNLKDQLQVYKNLVQSKDGTILTLNN
jgi:hypothetical protein